VAVCCQLNAMREPLGHIFHELGGITSITTANQPGNDEFGVSVDGGPGPHVPYAFRILHLQRHILLLGVAEAPNLIALDPATVQACDVFLLVHLARPSQVHEELKHGPLGRAGHAASGANRVPLHQGGNDLGSLGEGEFVHVVEYSLYA